MRKLILAFSFISVLQACTISQKQAETVAPADAFSGYKNKVAEATLLLKDGDLLVRNGTDLTSQFIKNFSKKDKNYSHSGLVFYKDQT
ncbi:MAG TPA: hypothetical protein VMR70_18940, partial [Flavisolibacter sp.]|nr:hypothetical protein [Flavisolibacter sp.]